MAQPNDTTKTVYDEHGRPIKVHAGQFEQAVAGANEPQTKHNPPQVVYMARPHEPVKPHISPAVKEKHEESKTLFPYLNLSEGEYVISAIKRHQIGILAIWGVVAIGILFLVLGIFISMGTGNTFGGIVDAENLPWLAMIFLGLIVLVFMGGILASVVYDGNRFFLTNESVTQHIQVSLFSKKEQTISLGNIEDASFTQHGIIQHMLNYGSLRLSTEGDETTYRFSFVEDPSIQVSLLNNAVEAFKNGRPVDVDEDQ